MVHDDEAVDRAGRITAEKTPVKDPVLELVSYVDGAPWRSLTPDDGATYRLFRMAWRWQGGWDREQHADFWAASLDLWPRKRGNRQTTPHLANWLWALRRDGLDDATIAARLGYSLDTLRRTGVLRAADEIAEEIERLPRKSLAELDAELAAAEAALIASRAEDDRLTEAFLRSTVKCLYLALQSGFADMEEIRRWVRSLDHAMKRAKPEAETRARLRAPYVRAVDIDPPASLFGFCALAEDALTDYDRRARHAVDEMGVRARRAHPRGPSQV